MQKAMYEHARLLELKSEGKWFSRRYRPSLEESTKRTRDFQRSCWKHKHKRTDGLAAIGIKTSD